MQTYIIILIGFMPSTLSVYWGPQLENGIFSSKNFVTVGWGTFVDNQIKVWEKLYTVWIKGVKRGGIIYYERIEADTETELLRLGGLMGLTWIDKNRLHCALNRGRPIDWRDPSSVTSR